MVLCVGMGELELNVPQSFYVICKVLIMMPFKPFCVKSTFDKSCFFPFCHILNDWQI